MFLDNTYFQGELTIPNLKFRDIDVVGVAAMIQVTGENTLEWFIEKYEGECLERILGKEMYNHFIEGVKEENEDWLALKDEIFIKKDRFGYSPVANYVYYHLSRDSRSQTSLVGEVRAKIDHTDIVSDSSKLVKAWNGIEKMVEKIHRFIRDNEDKYGKLDTCHRWFKPINSFNL